MQLHTAPTIVMAALVLAGCLSETSVEAREFTTGPNAVLGYHAIRTGCGADCVPSGAAFEMPVFRLVLAQSDGRAFLVYWNAGDTLTGGVKVNESVTFDHEKLRFLFSEVGGDIAPAMEADADTVWVSRVDGVELPPEVFVNISAALEHNWTHPAPPSDEWSCSDCSSRGIFVKFNESGTFDRIEGPAYDPRDPALHASETRSYLRVFEAFGQVRNALTDEA